MKTSTFKLEEKLKCDGYDVIIGIDEAGRGPLAGPVVACACIKKCHAEFISASQDDILKEMPKPASPAGRQVQDDKKIIRNDKMFNLIRDSKTLSEKQRESLYDFIMENFYVGIGISEHAAIDRTNILQATYLAMRKAIASLSRNLKLETRNLKNNQNVTSYELRVLKTIILIDGNKPIPNISYEQKAIVNGDKIVKSISAASIIAKVSRDRIMRKMHKIYPEYSFDQHKGYGTRLHMECLKKHGPYEIHRKSFRPVAESSK